MMEDLPDEQLQASINDSEDYFVSLTLKIGDESKNNNFFCSPA